MIAFCKNKFHILTLFCSFYDLNFEYTLKENTGVILLQYPIKYKYEVWYNLNIIYTM